jgi:hypothetical protein
MTEESLRYQQLLSSKKTTPRTSKPPSGKPPNVPKSAIQAPKPKVQIAEDSVIVVGEEVFDDCVLDFPITPSSPTRRQASSR